MPRCLQAFGLGDAFEPVRAGLGRALLGFKVNVEEAVALVIAIGPRELVLQAPHKVAANVDAAFDGADILVCAAAVADYTPVRKADHKLKKANERLDCIELVETRDILASMSARKGDRVVVGFAAETDNLIEYASSKLASKGCDAIVANDVSRHDSTFGSDTDKVTWITADGAEELPCMPKNEAAFEILRRAALLYR